MPDLSKAALDALVAAELAKPQAAATQPANPPKKGVGVAPYAALWGGQMADLGTTLAALNGGSGAVEGNPIYGDDPSNAKIAAIKAGTAGGMTALMHYLNKSGHPGMAKVAGYAGGAAGAIPALLNARYLKK